MIVSCDSNKSLDKFYYGVQIGDSYKTVSLKFQEYCNSKSNSSCVEYSQKDKNLNKLVMPEIPDIGNKGTSVCTGGNIESVFQVIQKKSTFNFITNLYYFIFNIHVTDSTLSIISRVFIGHDLKVCHKQRRSLGG